MNCDLTNDQRMEGAKCRGYDCQPCRDFYKPAGKVSTLNHRWELLKKVLCDIHKLDGVGTDWFKQIINEITTKVDDNVTMFEIQKAILEIAVESGSVDKQHNISLKID